MSSRRLWSSAIACLALSACNTAYTHIGDEAAGFGEAAKYDQAVQTINPAPVYAANSAKPGSNGEVGSKAVERYRTDKVKAVEVMETTTSTSGGGGGGGSGPH